jgi:hypothetical protein
MHTLHCIEHVAAPIDYDLHGLVGIRLLNAPPGAAAAVARQVGLTPVPLRREPDIILRFVERLPRSSPVRFLGQDDAGFTDDAFLVLRGRYGTRARAQIPFEQIGKRCEITCETGLAAVPLLVPILNLTMLAKGVVPLHASAFTYSGMGVLVTGWSHGSKTGTLLAFMARGARYIGDDWIYISRDGRHMYGLPEPMQVKDWYLRDLPQYRARIGRGDRGRLRAIRMLHSINGAVLKGVGSGRSMAKVLRRILRLLEQQQSVHIPPQELFGEGSCPLAGTLEKIFLVVSHERPEVTLQPIDPREIARRMAFGLQHERLDFMSYYLKFRFAFPDARNELLEQADALERETLARALIGKDAYAVYHPYPATIPALFQAIRPHLGRPVGLHRGVAFTPAV